MASKNAHLESLILHAWVHSGYADCGYQQMTTHQKVLYNDIVGRNGEEAGLLDRCQRCRGFTANQGFGVCGRCDPWR